MRIFTLTKKGGSVADLIRRIEFQGNRISDFALETLQSQDFETKAGEANIALIPAGALYLDGISELELCGKEGESILASYNCVFTEMDDAPEFRIAYPSQPTGERIWFVHRPIKVAFNQFIFTVERNDDNSRDLKVLFPSPNYKLEGKTLLAVRLLPGFVCDRIASR